jgi:hypothetical protein
MLVEIVAILSLFSLSDFLCGKNMRRVLRTETCVWANILYCGVRVTPTTKDIFMISDWYIFKNQWKISRIMLNNYILEWSRWI